MCSSDLELDDADRQSVAGGPQGHAQSGRGLALARAGENHEQSFCFHLNPLNLQIKSRDRLSRTRKGRAWIETRKTVDKDTEESVQIL